MISVSQIYETILSQSRKDVRGLSFSPDDFNNVVIEVNQRIYRLTYHNFEASKLSMDESDSFKVVKFPINLDSNGIGILPPNYFHLVGDPYYIHPVLGRRKIDLVTSLEDDNREMDFYTKASDAYPTCFMGFGATSEDMSFYVTPKTCTPIYINYLREVVDPFLDYYVNDTTLEVTYMPVATVANPTVVVPLGCTTRSGISGLSNVVSLTKDFEWHPHDVPQIVNLLLGALGISLPDEMLVQVAEKDEPKIEQA